MLFYLVLLGLIEVSLTAQTGELTNPIGPKCGTKRCLATEYCSSFDTQCRSCSNICDPGNNHQPDQCIKDCQEYLHDQRYVLRKDLAADLSRNADEVKRLKTLVTITLTLTGISLLGVVFLLAWRFLWVKKLRKMVQAGWLRKKWVKKATNNNRVQDDAEVGPNPKQNGLKLAMPTISATVVAPANNVGDGTPNTTSTPLSRRHPSEDTTLDYAYDNLAMTPSSEAQQPRTKRESSF